MGLCTRHEPKIDLEVKNFMKMTNFREKNSRTQESFPPPLINVFNKEFLIFYLTTSKKISLSSENEPKSDLEVVNFMKMANFREKKF